MCKLPQDAPVYYLILPLHAVFTSHEALAAPQQHPAIGTCAVALRGSVMLGDCKTQVKGSTQLFWDGPARPMTSAPRMAERGAIEIAATPCLPMAWKVTWVTRPYSTAVAGVMICMANAGSEAHGP